MGNTCISLRTVTVGRFSTPGSFKKPTSSSAMAPSDLVTVSLGPWVPGSVVFISCVGYIKNRSAMRTWGLMLNFIPLALNAVLKYQHLGVALLQVKR